MALHKIIMPKTGAEMEEGRIVAWRKHEGDRVAKGDILLEIETDKVTMEVESSAAGTLRKVLFQDGDVVPATHLIAVLSDADEAIETIQELISGVGPAPVSATPGNVGPAPSPVIPENAGPALSPASSEKVKASPVARKLAQEKGIDLAMLKGSGPGGRIEKEDVLRTAESAPSVEPAKTQAEPAATVQLSAMRKVIGRRMSQSKREAPDFNVTMAIDMTRALARRADLKAKGEQVSINDLIVHAVARVLMQHPDFNAELEGETIRRHPEANINVAVGLDGALYVPVVRSAQNLSVEAIARETARLAAKAKAGQLTDVDNNGGTFTISNLGMFGVESFTAIINPPQAAILAVGAVAEQPVRNASGGFDWRPTMRVTLTADHRIVDGLGAARFLADLKAMLEA